MSSEALAVASPNACPLALRYVFFSVVLGLVQIIVTSHAASLQRGYRWTAGARDAVVPPLTGIAGRLERALRNFCETFPLFLAAVWVATRSGHCDGVTEVGCRMYLWARVAYVPLYVLGVPVVRSLVWNVATIGIAVILVGAWA
jgi:uncharacterized MAPEG superfamily protein